jgi:hypothetical protein
MRRAYPHDTNSPNAGLGANTKLNSFIDGLNRLAEHQLAARARGKRRGQPLSISDLAAFGLTWEDCRELASHGLVTFDRAGEPTKVGPNSPIRLTDGGLAFLQEAIPAGGLRPAYDIPSRKLTVAGEVIIRLAVQARNQAAVLAAIEVAGWKSRVAEPLRRVSRENNAHHLAVTTHNLNLHQTLIEFHSDDGSATWNWRPTSSRPPARYGTATRVSPNFDRT